MSHGPRTGNAVALTFHGAGDPRLATTLLAELGRAGARATVLAVGSWLEANPAMARAILDGGHELGNHTQTHPALRRLDGAACYHEIDGCRQVLQRLTGSPGRWFRPSGTPHATPLIAAAAGRAGYRTTLSYDVDPRDYADPGATAVRDRTLSAVRPGSIVSLHLGHAGTLAALPGILDGLRSRGLRAVTVGALLAP
jgi:peptidoglycan/xylan/chitin deacetylase (PgdA/CDA1 family)